MAEMINVEGYWVNTSNNSKTQFGDTFTAVVSGSTLVQTTRAILYESGQDAHKVMLQFTQAKGTAPTGIQIVVAISYTKV